MKRKLSFLVASVMVLSMLPAMGVSADTKNSILIGGGTVAKDYKWSESAVTAGEGAKHVPHLSIKDESKSAVKGMKDKTFSLTLENAEFELDQIGKADEYKKGSGAGAAVVAEDKPNGTKASITITGDPAGAEVLAGGQETEGGYTMTILNSTLAEVKVGVIESEEAIVLPLPVKMKGAGPATVKIGDVGGSSISSGTITFAVGSEGSTQVTIKDSTTTFASNLIVPDITITETVPDTIDFHSSTNKNKTIKLTAPNGFEWADPTLGTVSGYLGFEDTPVSSNSFVIDDKDSQVAVFSLNEASTNENFKPSSGTVGTLQISGLKLQKEGSVSDTPVGPVKVKVTVADGGTHTITVGEFAKKAVTLTAEDKALPEVVSGVYTRDGDDDVNRVLDVTIKESSVGAWNVNADAIFTLSDGVKFRAIELDTIDNTDGTGLAADEGDTLQLSADGQGGTSTSHKPESDGKNAKLTDTKFTIFSEGLTPASKTDRMELTFKVYVTVKPGFTGDIVFKTHEDNEAFGTDLSAVVGKAISPVTVTAATKAVQLGYMNIPLNDIIIKENAAGALKKENATAYNEKVTEEFITFKIGGYSNNTVRFKDVDSHEVLSGDIVVDKVDLKDGIIELKIKRESSTASEIKLSGITMDADRTIPEGKLDLRMAGTIIANSDGDDTAGNREEWGSFDVDYVVAVPGYVDIITAAPDKDTKYTTEVAVTVGQKSVTSNHKEYATDVASFNENGFVMVPTRAVSVALGLGDNQILWNASTKEVTILDTNRNRTSQFRQGTNVIKQSGMEIGFDGPSCKNVEGRTFLPFRALGEVVLGCPVSWDQATQTAYFNKGAAEAVANEAVVAPALPAATTTPAAQ